MSKPKERFPIMTIRTKMQCTEVIQLPNGNKLANFQGEGIEQKSEQDGSVQGATPTTLQLAITDSANSDKIIKECVYVVSVTPVESEQLTA